MTTHNSGAYEKKKQRLDRIFGAMALLLLIVATWLSFSGSWLAAEINSWQARMLGENKFYPVLTIGILVLPVLALLVPLKLLLLKRIRPPHR